MAAKFEIYKDKAGEFRFRLKAANGEVIASSEGYKSKVSAEKGIESIKANAAGAPVVDTTAYLAAICDLPPIPSSVAWAATSGPHDSQLNSLPSIDVADALLHDRPELTEGAAAVCYRAIAAPAASARGCCPCRRRRRCRCCLPPHPRGRRGR
jgi:uncharacterized protein